MAIEHKCGFILGFFLGPFGILIAAVLSLKTKQDNPTYQPTFMLCPKCKGWVRSEDVFTHKCP